MKKYLCIVEIKPEFREEYIALHKNPWREMLEAIRDAGYTKEVIYYYKDQSIIYLECPDDTSHEECDKKLRATDVCKKWDLTVCPWFSTAKPEPMEKIFDLNQQLDGELLPD